MNDDNILLNEEDLFEEECEDIEILSEEEAEKVLEKGKNRAKEILFDEEKLAEFLIRLEKKANDNEKKFSAKYKSFC